MKGLFIYQTGSISEYRNGELGRTKEYLKKIGIETVAYGREYQAPQIVLILDDDDKDAEIARLTAENAELRARLDKDGLPVKVGDTIYIEFLDGIKEWQVEKIELRKDEYIVYCGHADTDNYTFVTSKGYEMWWFTDPAKAEARQKELQGGE